MTEGNVDFNKERILAIVMGSRGVPVLEAILPSYIVVRNAPFLPRAGFIINFPPSITQQRDSRRCEACR